MSISFNFNKFTPDQESQLINAFCSLQAYIKTQIDNNIRDISYSLAGSSGNYEINNFKMQLETLITNNIIYNTSPILTMVSVLQKQSSDLHDNLEVLSDVVTDVVREQQKIS